MKRGFSRMLSVVLAAIPFSGQNPQSFPFAQYPAGTLYRVKPSPPKLTTRSQREFRTVLRQGAQKGPNFAGHYTVIEWGCGSNCVVFVVVDAATGRVYDRDMPPINDEYPCGLSYRLESRLLVIETSSTLNGNCEAHLYTWNVSHFVPVEETKTFTAPDRAFQFSYPNDFQVCTAGKIESCRQSFMPVCERDALVCVSSNTKLFEGTNIGAVSFQVREIYRFEMMTPDVCATPYPITDSTGPWRWPEFHVSAARPAEMIGGVQFLHGGTGEGATSHSLGSELYRGFHKQRCFELRVSTTAADPSVSDPPLKTLTPAQQKHLDQTMSQILHSLRFSN